MEQIISKLSEIETSARVIMEDTDRQKKALSEEMEKQCKEFDAALAEETDRKIGEIRRNLESEKNDLLSSLSKETEASIQALDSYYEKNHQRLSKEIFEKILE
ncbi:hypothetical protein [Ruminococcus sp. 5_1_39BFAA]|uniref:hypothetical protein n=1 Tax=Ruminococcus sp. 5_1_39BFAA TaxID=457412 RepID=UPI003562E7D8